VSGYGLDDRSSNPGKIKRVCFSPTLGSTQLPTDWLPMVLSPEVNLQEREADHSFPSSGRVKTGGAIPAFLDMPLWNRA
jgi:hypothetical protein